MKKTLICVFILTLALTVLCSACGGKTESEPASTAVPEATEIPSVTAPPEGAEAGNDIVSADNNSAPTMVSREDWLASLSEEQRMVEEQLVGSTVEELYAAIGEPISTTYTTSCLVQDGEDGILLYDGFVVATTRFPNGVERVMGTQ